MHIILINTDKQTTQKIKQYFHSACIFHCQSKKSLINILNKINTMNIFIYLQKQTNTNPVFEKYIKKLSILKKVRTVTIFTKIQSLP